MHYKVKTAWVFVVLLLIVALMALYPADWVIGLGIVGVPIVILYQVIVVLRANEKSKHEFTDDKWYEDR